MAVDKGVTEIADSEEEPLTSSPGAVSDAAVDKLSATARQGAQAVACSHQEPTGRNANEISGRTDGLDADHVRPSADLSRSHINHVDLQPARQPETNCINTCTTEAVTRLDLPSPQPIVDAVATDGREIYNFERRTDLEGSKSAEPSIVPENGTAIRLGEDVEIRNDNAGCDHEPSILAEKSAHQHASSDAEQTYIPELRMEHETDSNNPSTHESAQDNFANATGNTRIDMQKLTDVELLRSRPETVEGDALAESPGHDQASKASVELHTSRTAVSSERHPDAGDTSPQAVGVLGSKGTETSPATHLTASGPEKSQKDASSRLPGLHGGNGTGQNIEPKPIMSPGAAPVPPYGAEITASPGERDSNNVSDPPFSVALQSNTADGNEKPALQTRAENEKRETVSKQSTTTGEVPPDLPAESSNDASIAEKVPEFASHDPAMIVSTSHQDESTTDNCQSLASTQAEGLKGSGSSASRASEPASPAKLSPQEVTLAELRAQKALLLASLKGLPAIQVLIEENQDSDVDMSDNDDEPTEADITAAANKIVKEHIKLLHEYNELKDVGQGLMGLIADQRGVRIVEVQDEFGIDGND